MIEIAGSKNNREEQWSKSKEQMSTVTSELTAMDATKFQHTPYYWYSSSSSSFAYEIPFRFQMIERLILLVYMIVETQKTLFRVLVDFVPLLENPHSFLVGCWYK